MHGKTSRPCGAERRKLTAAGAGMASSPRASSVASPGNQPIDARSSRRASYSHSRQVRSSMTIPIMEDGRRSSHNLLPVSRLSAWGRLLLTALLASCSSARPTELQAAARYIPVNVRELNPLEAVLLADSPGLIIGLSTLPAEGTTSTAEIKSNEREIVLLIEVPGRRFSIKASTSLPLGSKAWTILLTEIDRHGRVGEVTDQSMVGEIAIQRELLHGDPGIVRLQLLIAGHGRSLRQLTGTVHCVAP